MPVSVAQTIQKTKPINLKQSQPKKGVAAFIMGLNNRVVHIDRRLSTLEKHHQHLNQNQFKPGHIVVCILGIALISASSSIYLGQQLSKLNNRTTSPQIAPAIVTAMPEITSTPETSLPHSTKELLWPLEQTTIANQNIQYLNIKHGIIIPAKLGDPVVAVDAGKVIYSGNGIADYGNLILIQHADDLISVYGNTYQAFIKEGDPIEKGQLIAAAGEISGKGGLYFELRFKGAPEDPFNYYVQ